MKHLIVNEVYKSIQGESSFAGLPCVFIRLTGCPLRCSWCDTTYSFRGGDKKTVDEVLSEVLNYDVPCVELTGGEPLSQKLSCELMEALLKHGKKVLLETSGSISLESVPKEVHIIMDLKCPASKMSHKNRLQNLSLLKPTDEVKFVIANREDYLWTKNMIDDYELSSRFQVLLSPSWGELDPKILIEWFLEDKLDCRLNLQLHKYIWDPSLKGV